MKEYSQKLKKFFKESFEVNAFPATVAVSSLALFLLSQHNFLFFHVLIEMFTAVIAFSIFVIAWSSRRYIDNSFLIILGVGYFFVGVSDLIHVLSYKGMPIFPDYSMDISNQLWILARYLEALTFLAALLFLKKDSRGGPRIPTSKANLIFISYFIVFILSLLAIFYWKIFPSTYVEGIGLTSFKKNSEYLISYIFLVSIGLVFWKSNRFDSKMANFLSFALIIKIVSELLFSRYVNTFDFFSIIGLLLKFISFALLYKAVLEIGLMDPYRFLFFDLKKSQENYRKAQKELRERIEENLIEAYKHLGVANRKISLLLEMEEHSRDKKNRNNIIEYIISLAKIVSHAKIVLLYRYEGNNFFSLIMGDGYSESDLRRIKGIYFSQAVFLKNLMKEKKRINSSCDSFRPNYLNQWRRVKYFVALPILREKYCAGFLFLGFEDSTSLDSQELEFLDIFSMHVSSALSRLNVIKAFNEK